MKIYVLSALGSVWCVCDKKHLPADKKLLAEFMSQECGHKIKAEEVGAEEMTLNEPCYENKS